MNDKSGYTLTLTQGDGDTSGPVDPECSIGYIQEECENWCLQGEWYGEDGCGCEVLIQWEITNDENGEIEYDGEITIQIPDNERVQVKVAGGDPDCDHDWERDDRIGCDSNPGVVGIGGTAVSVTDICGTCGIIRHTRHNGSQRNPGQPEIQVSYEVA